MIDNENNNSTDSLKELRAIISQATKETLQEAKIEEQKKQEQDKIINEANEFKKKQEQELSNIENQKKILDEQRKSLENTIPSWNGIIKKFDRESELQDGVAFIDTIQALVKDNDFTPQEISDIVNSKMNEKDFAKFKSNDSPSQVVTKLVSIFNKYKTHSQEQPIEKKSLLPKEEILRNDGIAQGEKRAEFVSNYEKYLPDGSRNPKYTMEGMMNILNSTKRN